MVDGLEGPSYAFNYILINYYFTKVPLNGRCFSLLWSPNWNHNLNNNNSFMNLSAFRRASGDTSDRGFESCATLVCLSLMYYIVILNSLHSHNPGSFVTQHIWRQPSPDVCTKIALLSTRPDGGGSLTVLLAECYTSRPYTIACE